MRRSTRSLSLGLYALLTGLGFGLAIFVWRVWSDNAFLYVYFIALLLLLVGSIAALVALARVWSLPKAIATLVLAAVASFLVVGPLAGVLAGPLAEGGGSQSPCIAAARQRGGLPPHPDEPPGYRPPDAAQIVVYERAAVQGGLSQFLLPFIAGTIPLALAIRRGRPARSVLLRGAGAAATVVAYVYLRGPSAWCGQLLGLDGLIALILGVMYALDTLRLPGPRERPEQAV